MNKQKMVLVPQSDLDKLEDARLYLYQMFTSTNDIARLSFGVTDIMWKITHTKYEEIKQDIDFDEYFFTKLKEMKNAKTK